MDITINNLYKSFDHKPVLKELNLIIREGRVNCIMGSSGIGKTTLMNILMGLIKPDSGEIKGLEDKRFVAVFQEDRLIEHWDAVRNVLLTCDSTVTEAEVCEAFHEVGLTDYKNKPVKDLSGGMRRRVAIIRALLADSNLIILDEPFKGLDEALKIQVMDYTKKKTAGKTVILVTHVPDEAQALNALLLNLV